MLPSPIHLPFVREIDIREVYMGRGRRRGRGGRVEIHGDAGRGRGEKGGGNQRLRG